MKKHIIENFKKYKETNDIRYLLECKKLISEDGFIVKVENNEGYCSGRLKSLNNNNAFYFTHSQEEYVLIRLIEEYFEIFNPLKNIVLLIRDKDALEEAIQIFPVYLKEEDFSYYINGKYHFPLLIWDITSNHLYHQGLPDISFDWDEYIPLIKRAITWGDFKKQNQS